MTKQLHHHRTVDGGKLHPRTKAEIQAMLDQKYVFSGFNILIYAQNYVLKMASGDVDFIIEANREALYSLYEFALELEPKPERDELTFSQQQLINKARTFVTMKMKRRQNLRETKKETKNIIKMKKMMGHTLQENQDSILQAIQAQITPLKKEKEETKAIETPTDEKPVTPTKTAKPAKEAKEVSPTKDVSPTKSPKKEAKTDTSKTGAKLEATRVEKVTV